MKKLTHFLSILALAGSAALAGCAKTQGCTDSDATNFSSSAEENDGSCTYEAKILFWQYKSDAEGKVNTNTSTLYYYIDNVYIGSSAANLYVSSEPSDCSSTAVYTCRKSLGKSRGTSMTVKVIDEDNWVWFNSSIYLPVYPSLCKTIRM
jgi:hypothetical protein